MENIVMKQEEKLNNYINKLNELEVNFKRKNKMLKENEAYAKELIKFVEEQKNTINQLKYQKKYSIKRNNNIFNNKSISINNKSNNILLPEIKKVDEINNIKHNENSKTLINEIENENNINDKKQKNNNQEYDLMENDEQNQKKLKEFKNLMDNLVNGLNDINNI